jgi:hypothetical protein
VAKTLALQVTFPLLLRSRQMHSLLAETPGEQVSKPHEKRSFSRWAGTAKLGGATLIVGLSLGAAKGDPAGGKFGFSHPNFTGAAGAMTAQQFVLVFDAAMHNPDVFRQWIQAGTDIRKLNPSGVYLKHLNLRTIDSAQLEPSVEGHPDYRWIKANHPEWILRDAYGKTVPLYRSTEESLDFGNDAYLDWVLNTWMPVNYLDSTDSDPNLITWYLQDNGDFRRMHINCAASDAVCHRYNSDAGVQSAFKRMFDRFKARWLNKRIMVSTGLMSYLTPTEQLPVFKDVLSHADGYFSECLTNNPCYWNGQPNSAKRNALEATMQLADWLAANDKYFFPNIGMDSTTQASQAQTDYGFAFFNLVRSGNKQFFSKVIQDSGGMWQPKSYPEQTLALGNPLEARTQVAPNVYRRGFEEAIAYVNLSDSAVSIDLPQGPSYKNSLGKVVSSPLTLASFGGLTVYGSNRTPTAPSNLKATTVSPTQVNLSWTGTSNNEAGFKIGRSSNGVDFTALPLVAANATSYKDTTVARSTRYYYRVRAYNDFGYSGFSNVVSLKTPP